MSNVIEWVKRPIPWALVKRSEKYRHAFEGSTCKHCQIPRDSAWVTHGGRPAECCLGRSPACDLVIDMLHILDEAIAQGRAIEGAPPFMLVKASEAQDKANRFPTRCAWLTVVTRPILLPEIDPLTAIVLLCDPYASRQGAWDS